MIKTLLTLLFTFSLTILLCGGYTVATDYSDIAWQVTELGTVLVIGTFIMTLCTLRG